MSVLRVTVMMVFLFGMALASGCSSNQIPAADKYAALTPAQLQEDVRKARANEDRFNEVYKEPKLWSNHDRNLAVWNMPPIPLPKECMAPGSETSMDCMRYAARLHAIPFFAASGLRSFDSGFYMSLQPVINPEGY